MSDTTTDTTAPAEASSSTSPIVRVDWVQARMLPAPKSHAEHGLTVRLRARSLTIYRANGDVVTRTPKAGTAEVEQLLRDAARTAFVEAIGAEAARLAAEAGTDVDTSILATAHANVKAAGSMTLPATARKPRTDEIDLTADAEAAALAAVAALAEAKAKAEAEAKGK